MAGDLFHGREVTLCGSGVGRRTEHDGAVRGLRDQPQDGIQVAGALGTAGLEGLHDLLWAPHRVAREISAQQAAAILGLRHAHLSWGPKKLRAKLLQRAAEQAWPAASTINELLRCQGLSQRRKRCRHAVPNPGPLTVAASPNDVSCITSKAGSASPTTRAVIR